MKWNHFLLCLIVLAGISSCEKDDICVASDSAYLNITFYSAESPEVAKSVTNFSLKELNGSIIGSFESTTVASIALMLPVDDTEYSVIFEQQVEENESTKTLRDTVVFSYTPKATFTSRACGFIRTYEDLSASREGSTGWVSEVRVLQSSVTNTSDEHVAIYH